MTGIILIKISIVLKWNHL